MSAAVHYFSNSTEGDIWMARWCNRCQHDHSVHVDEDYDDGCPHLAFMYAGVQDDVFIPTPTVRRDGRIVELSSWECVEFARCACDNGPDDPGVQPPPEPDPNQLALFDLSDVAAGVPADVWHDTFTLAPSSRPN